MGKKRKNPIRQKGNLLLKSVNRDSPCSSDHGDSFLDDVSEDFGGDSAIIETSTMEGLVGVKEKGKSSSSLKIPSPKEVISPLSHVAFPPLCPTWAAEVEEKEVMGHDDSESEVEEVVQIKSSTTANTAIATESIPKDWRNLFRDNRAHGAGMSLNFSPPSSDFLSISEEEWEEGGKLWNSSAIGHVLGLDVRYKAMVNYIQMNWKGISMPEVFLLKSGVFLFKFISKESRDEVLAMGPWFYGNRPLLLRPWSDDSNLNKFDTKTFPIWIQFPGLSLNLWNSTCLSKLASMVGRPISTDKLTARLERLTYARVLVEVTMPKILPKSVEIRGPKGLIIEQEVTYEFYPKWCGQCSRLGHDEAHCGKRKITQQWVPKKKTVDSSIIQNNVSTSEQVPTNEHVLVTDNTPDEGMNSTILQDFNGVFQSVSGRHAISRPINSVHEQIVHPNSFSSLSGSMVQGDGAAGVGSSSLRNVSPRLVDHGGGILEHQRA